MSATTPNSVLEALTPSIEEIVTNTDIVEVTSAGPQGPAGGVGPRFLAVQTSYPISGHRVIATAFNGLCSYADSSNASLASLVLGISIGAAESGALATLQYDGEMVEPSWSWTAYKPVFCGPAGTLTQTPPTAGFCMIVGVATSPTSLVIAIKQPILL